MKNKSALSLLSALIIVLGIVPHPGGRQAPQSSKEDCEKVEMKIESRSQPTATVENQSKPPWKKDTTDDKGNKGSAPAQPAEPSAPYHIVSSIELGVRGVSVNGNQNKYRSDLNYGPGFKIFDGSLMMKDNGGGGGPLFDQLMVNTFGWSNDPNRYLRVSAEKTKLYKFDANYRRFDYFNSLTNLALNQHISNTEYRQGDFDLTLFPANEKFRLNVGYSLDRNSGPSVTTYDYQRDEFPILEPVRQSADDYRIGFDAKLSVFDISFLQGWRVFREDSTYTVDQPQPGNNPINTS